MPRPPVTTLALAVVLLLGSSAAIAAPPAPPTPPWQDKVDLWVLETGSKGETEFLVFLADQADLSPAASLHTKAARGEYVYRTLSQHAERTQASLRRWLAELGVEYRPFWVANMIWVRAGLGVVQALAERADVAHIYANPQVKMDFGEMEPVGEAAAAQPDAVEWNIQMVNAPQVWAAGDMGAGVVIGINDTGVHWTHEALKNHYRGWNGTTASHDYNWHDAVHLEPGGHCDDDSLVPCDDYGHGTQMTGIAVGDDGAGNQIGMAPGAKWIACRNAQGETGTLAGYSECYQWFLAPTRVDGTAPDPSKAPDVISNSWFCTQEEGCTDPNTFLTVVQNVTAAGILTVHAAGNSGYECSTIAGVAPILDEVFTVGATDKDDGIARFSSRGPVSVDGSGRMKPNIAAPGQAVRSSTMSSSGINNNYFTGSGTSQATPHVAGLVGLLISANPSLRGDVDAIRYIIEQTAVHKTTIQGCGGDTPTSVPNNTYGWGRIDAWAAYQEAIGPCSAPAVITDLAIATLDAAQIKLTWAARAGASTYDVWWNTSAYFTPGAACPSESCASVTATEFTQAALGETTDNRSYLVQPRAGCGAVQATPSNRVGEFEFGLVKGAP